MNYTQYTEIGKDFEEFFRVKDNATELLSIRKRADQSPQLKMRFDLYDGSMCRTTIHTELGEIKEVLDKFIEVYTRLSHEKIKELEEIIVPQKYEDLKDEF